MKKALKDAQEAVKKAQEVQKKAQEEATRVKESMKELGMHEHIKALNNDIEVNVESDQSPQSSVERQQGQYSPR